MPSEKNGATTLSVDVLTSKSVATPVSWADEWSVLAKQAASPERNRTLAALWRAHGDDPRVLERLLAMHPDDRVAVVGLVLHDLVAQSPDAAVSEAIRLCDEDQAYSLEHGRALIAALAEVGQYRVGLGFVLGETADGYLGENNQKWLTTLFTTWTQQEPTAAAQAAVNLLPTGSGSESLQAVVSVWAKTDPAKMADFLLQLPAGPERAAAFETGLRQWVDANAAEAAAWIARRPAGPELDSGLAAVATLPHLTAEGSATALRWAEKITDSTLRSNTLALVVQSWAESDPAAAEAYASSSPLLTSADRTVLLGRLAIPKVARKNTP